MSDVKFSFGKPRFLMDEDDVKVEIGTPEFQALQNIKERPVVVGPNGENPQDLFAEEVKQKQDEAHAANQPERTNALLDRLQKEDEEKKKLLASQFDKREADMKKTMAGRLAGITDALTGNK